MGWSGIILALLEFFGPILAEWFRKWLEGRMARAAERLPDFEVYGTEHGARNALFAQLLDDLPTIAPLRRRIFTRLAEAAEKASVTSQGPMVPLDEESAVEIAGLADRFDNDVEDAAEPVG